MSWPGLIGVEKIEDQKARAAIKAQIEVSCEPLCLLTSQADKRERAEKAAREKAAREGATLPPTTSSANSAPSKPVAAVKSSENPETRLQVGPPHEAC
jgi:D-alanyl-D-alanine carboxypeptidase